MKTIPFSPPPSYEQLTPTFPFSALPQMVTRPHGGLPNALPSTDANNASIPSTSGPPLHTTSLLTRPLMLAVAESSAAPAANTFAATSPPFPLLPHPTTFTKSSTLLHTTIPLTHSLPFATVHLPSMSP